jgi:hypothetical protein
MWHAWYWERHTIRDTDVRGTWLGRYGSMATARDVVEDEAGERLRWERFDRGDRWEAWSHREPTSSRPG